jgi:hypothetical protein
MNLQQAIEARRHSIVLKMNAFLKVESDAEREWNRAHREKELATKELLRKLEQVSNPFDKRMRELQHIKEKSRASASRLEWEKNHVEMEVSAEFAVKSGRFEDADSFAGYLSKNNVNWSDIKMIKKRLSNGVTLFAKTDELFAVHFAVYGTSIIGFHHTKKSEHPGDQSDYSAWIGVVDLKMANRSQSKQLNKWGSPYTDNLRFREWKDAVSNVDASKAVAIDISKVGNQHMMSCEYSMRFENEESTNVRS